VGLVNEEFIVKDILLSLS